MQIEITSIAESSQIEKVAYDVDTRILTITFKRGSVEYEYQGVLFHDAMGMLVPGQSVGKYLNQVIKPTYLYRLKGTDAWKEPIKKEEVTK